MFNVLMITLSSDTPEFNKINEKKQQQLNDETNYESEYTARFVTR